MPTGSPLLDEYNQTGVVSPGLQRALDQTKASLASMQPPPALPAGQTPPNPMAGMNPQLPAAAGPSALQREGTRLADTGSGIDQIKHPLLRVGAHILEGLGDMFAPAVTAALPGTQMHHNMLVNQNNRAQLQEQGQQKAQTDTAHTRAQIGQENATADEANARAESLRNPAEKFASSPGGIFDTHTGQVTSPVEKTPTNDFEAWRLQNPNAPVENWVKLQHPEKATEYEDFRNGYLKSHPGIGTDEIAKAFSAQTQKQPQNEYEDFKTGYAKTHPQADAFEVAREYARAHQAPQQPPQAMMFVPDGKGGYTSTLVKPGQSVAGGAVSPTQAGAQGAAANKGNDAVSSAVKYGQDYVKSGQFTGPKDEALLEAFFEVAKPSSGFRMTEPQIDMLMHARGWMESAQGLAYHAKTGTWFAPEQRQQIVDAMQSRAESKGVKAPADKQLPGGISLDDVDAEIKRRKGGK